ALWGSHRAKIIGNQFLDLGVINGWAESAAINSHFSAEVSLFENTVMLRHDAAGGRGVVGEFGTCTGNITIAVQLPGFENCRSATNNHVSPCFKPQRSGPVGDV